MRKPTRKTTRIAAVTGVAAALVAGSSVLGARALKDPPPPVRATAGDSLAYQAGTHLAGENVAVGGTTVCDTATETNPVDGSYMPLPYAEHLHLHLGGHSWGNYDLATAKVCLDYILSRYGGTQIYIATNPDASHIFCEDPVYTDLVLTSAGIPHNNAALYGNPHYELYQRLVDFDLYIRTLPASHANVHVVNWDNITAINPSPDCTHFSDDGVQAANRVNSAGF